MQRSPRKLSGSLIRRGLLLTITAIGIALYGLASAGGQSLALRPTASTDYGSTSQLSVGEAISPTNSSVNVVARGPNNSLMFYWNVAGTWHGPLGLGGAGTTFSAPSITAESSGNFDVAVQGPSHTIFFYWDVSGTWYGPLQVAAPGSTYSSPSIIVSRGGNLALAAQGPSNSMFTYWNVSGTWYGPLGIGGANSAFSAPSVASDTCGGGCTSVSIYSAGPNNDMRQWYSDSRNPWGSSEFSSDGSAFSAPSGYEDVAVFQGPSHTLQWSFGSGQEVQLATAGNVYSAPSFTSGGSGNDRITAQGPSHSLSFWHGSNNCCGNDFQGPLQLGGPGTTYSAPAMAEDPNDDTLADLAVQGPGNSLWFYWQIGGVSGSNGTWYGPYQVAGPGTTFGSSN